MKVEQVMMLLKEKAYPTATIIKTPPPPSSSSSSVTTAINSSAEVLSEATKNGDLCRHHSESFRQLDKGVPGRSQSWEDKLSWLRSQIIGAATDAEFDSPFGKRRLTYADHTASAKSLRYIEDYIIQNVLPFYANTHTSDNYVGRRTTKMVHEVSHYIKKCLGGGSEDAIIFCGSGTTAAIKRLQEVMGIAVPSILRERALKCLSNEERWVVFVGPYEHHSNLLSWRQSLAEVVEIGLDDNGLTNMEDLRRKLESYKDANRPILGSFSACSNVTGIYSDTRSIATLFHQYGGFACFDFAASGPYVKIDMRSGEMDGYDAVFLSPHKFIGGPGSPGILLMSKVLYRIGSFPPSTCGGGTVDYVNGFNEEDTLYLTDIEERETGGTPPITQITRAALAFWVKEYIGYQVIEKQEDFFIQTALKRLLPNQNIKVLGNKTAERLAILSFIIYSTSHTPSSSLNNGGNLWEEMGNTRDKPLHGPFVATLLNDLFGIEARGGCACAGPYGHSLLGVDETQSHKIRAVIQQGYTGVKPGWTRVSFPYYMSNEEFEFILAAIEFIAKYGQRFLPLYHFSWKTGSWCFRNPHKDIKVGKGNNQPIHIMPLATATQETSLPGEDILTNARHPGIISTYASYLENAKRIAGLLPNFPSQHKIPEAIDPHDLYFRI